MCQESKHIQDEVQLFQGSLVQFSPNPLLVSLIMGPDVVHLALGDNAQVDVAAGAQVIKDTCSNGVSHQPLGVLLLRTHKQH